MPETNTQPDGGEAVDATRVTRRILHQYIRDLSFENMRSKNDKGGDGQQKVSVQVSLKNRRLGDNTTYEVTTKLDVTSKSVSSGDPLFLLDIEYAGVFQFEGLTNEQLDTYLHTDCPQMMFPSLRSIVSNVTQDGGFPPLILDKIDFVSLYRKELSRRSI